MIKFGALVVIALVAVTLYLLLSHDKPPTSTTTSATTGSAVAPATAPTTATPSKKSAPVAKVGRVSLEERMRLAEQITKARANRSATGTGTTGTTPRPELAEHDDAKLVRTTMKEAMREIIPYLADCYDKAGDKLPDAITVVADLQLTGDPDIGTIIDTNAVTEIGRKPLEPAFELCLKDALVTVQMPPLSEGGEVRVTYPFKFARNAEEPEGSGSAR